MIMIRRISLLFLLAHTSVALAQPLYKWLEPDGTITFSPTPPASGVPFEKLDPESPVASMLEPAATAAQPLAEAAAPARAMTRLEYAPGNPRDLPAAISRSTVQPIATGVAVGPQDTSTAPDATAQADIASAASYKQSRCQDLKKRVTSLERRMKSRLSPEDMDNTVMHMARYQRSYDQYCAQ